MEILMYLSSSCVFAYVGYIFGMAKRIDDSEQSNSEPYKEGYIKGYSDCLKYFEHDREQYYKDVMIK